MNFGLTLELSSSTGKTGPGWAGGGEGGRESKTTVAQYV